MTKRNQFTFIGLMSLIFAIIVFLPTILINKVDIKTGYYTLIFGIGLLLMLFYYRKRDYQNASFRKLLMTGSSVVVFSLILNYAIENIHMAIIGEDGVQQMIDRKVEQRIKTYEGSRLNIFDIEKKVIKQSKTDTAEEVVNLLLGVLFFILLVFIFSLILRTDKEPRETEIP